MHPGRPTSLSRWPWQRARASARGSASARGERPRILSGIDPTSRAFYSCIVDALRTDLYQLTMAAGYFHRGMTSAVATCEMFVRRLPPRRRYLVAMGMERVLTYLENLRFSDEQIAYLSTVPSLREAMTPAFVNYLRRFSFTGDIAAVPEGTVVFAGEPLARVRAPIIEAQLIETFLLSAMNHATLIASKAARIVTAAGDAQVLEFGTRRNHPDAAVDAARAAYAVGCAGTSNVEAGMRFGIPIMGTAAHMWTMAHPSEEAAFAAYTEVFPSSSLLLIDTYDTLRGAERAATIARDKLKGVRLDSGDLISLSRSVRAILDRHGLTGAQIVASGDLNEYRIAELRRAGAPIDVYGVGTDLVTSVDAPALGGVYKLVEIEREGQTFPIAKFSEAKATLPGAHQVYRMHDAEGMVARDVITLAEEPALDQGSGGAKALLVPQMQQGKRTVPAESLETIRARAKRELASLPAPFHLLEEPSSSWVGIPKELSPRLVSLIEQVRGRVIPGVPQ